MAEAVPMLLDPRTKNTWCYIAGPVAVARMVKLGLVKEADPEGTFRALGEEALRNLHQRKLLEELMASGDIVMLRMEATDG